MLEKEFKSVLRVLLNYSLKMDKSIQSLKKDISTLRTGRANTNMLDTQQTFMDSLCQLIKLQRLVYLKQD